MRNLSLALGFALLSSACGSSNLNTILVSKGQQEAVDQLTLEAQYHYDKGSFDKALSLTNKALAINPYGEAALVLNGYIYLSKAGLDGFNLSKTLISNSETTSTATDTTGDETSDNFNKLKKVLNLSDSDFETMGTLTPVGSSEKEVYIPKSAPDARIGGSPTLTYINRAVAILCPLIDPATTNPPGDADTRHTCDRSPYPVSSLARSNFAWALAHLGEAITFYSVVLYDSDANGKPDIQEVIPAQTSDLPTTELLNRIVAVNSTLSSIFPTDATQASSSMLNGLFSNLKTTASSLAAIPGIPADVTKSVNKSIADLDTKINSIGGAASSTDASVQNEAIKNALTTGLSTDMKAKIENAEASGKFTPEEGEKACCLYRSINAAAPLPSSCTPTEKFTDAYCAPILASAQQ